MDYTRKVLDDFDVFKDTAPVKENTEVVRVMFEIEGPSARRLMNEASRRGVSYSEMAKILFLQGEYYWTPKS